MQNLNGTALSWFEDESDFCETLLTDKEGLALELDPWQQSYLRDDSPFLATIKTRQGGYSYAEAAKGLARSHIRPFYEKFFVSKSLEEAKRKIQYVQELWSTMPRIYQLRKITDAKTQVAFEDSKGRISRLTALSSRQPRGMDGDISIDEIAHFPTARQVFEAANGLIVRGQGRRLSIGSSPAAKSGIFYEIVSNFEKRYNGFQLYKVPWWLTKALCTNPSEAVKMAPYMTTEERVAMFGSPMIKDQFVILSLDVFIQEYECGFMDEVSAFMPYELIWSCGESQYGTDATEGEVEFLFDYRHLREAKEDTIGEDFWKWVRKSCKGMVEIGVDIGRKKDLYALVVTDEVDGVKDVRAVVTLDRTPFAIQEQVMTNAVRIVKPQKCRIDQGGMGMPLAESMVAKFGSIVEAIGFSNHNKGMMASNIKARFEKHKIRIPAWRPLESNIHSIRRRVTEGGLITYEADASDHHGDIYWALALTDLRPMEVKTGYVPESYSEAYETMMNERKMKEQLKRMGLTSA